MRMVASGDQRELSLALRGKAAAQNHARFGKQFALPVWRGGGHEAALLASAYKNSLALAVQYTLKSIAFPSISTGAFGYPLEEAATIAMQTVAQFLQEKQTDAYYQPLTLVRFVLFDAHTFEAYQKALKAIQ